MEEIYIRKLYPHDITHEVSVTGGIVRTFFESQTRGIPFFREDGIVRYFVDINNATDPRFGRDFKRMYAADFLEAGDFLLFMKRPNGFFLYPLGVADPNHSWVNEMFDTRRHLIVKIRNDVQDTRRNTFFETLRDGIKEPLSFRKDGMF